jgi:hypothetical protein
MSGALLSKRHVAVLSAMGRTATEPSAAPAAVTPLPTPSSPPVAPPKARSGSEKRKRGRVVRMRLDASEQAQLEARAGSAGLALGAYLRACALETAGPRARRRAPIDRELLARTNADLNRIGNNLNQLARAMNRGRDAEQAAITGATGELRDVLAMLRKALGYDRQR